MQAAGGLISMTGEPGRPGVRVGSSLIDQGTGTWAALGVLAALLEREQTGEGSIVDVSLYETALGYIGYHLAGYLADGTVPHGQGTRFPMVAPYQVFPTRDGELMIAGGNDRLFASICDVVGLAALVDDPRFRTNRTASTTATSSARSSSSRSASATPPIGRAPLGGRRAGGGRRRCRRRRSRPADRGARDHAASSTTPSIPDLRLTALPVSFDGERALHRSAPPAVGEHTAEILLEAGYDNEEIAALAAEGVIRA